MNYTIFDSLLEPVFILNSEGFVVHCNETAATICGSTPRRIIRGKHKLDQILQFTSPLEILANLKSISAPTPYKELEFSTSSYDNGKAQITIQPYMIPTLTTEYLVFFRDVTLEERLQNKYRAELDQKEAYINELKLARNQLEIYSKDLESLVQKRTAEIQDLNVLMKALLDSLNQAFFVFDKDGQCAPFYSKACLDLLETAPNGQSLWNILKIETTKVDSFKSWLFTVFSELLPFDDLKALGPNQIPHPTKRISLEYFPIRNLEGQIDKIVCIGSDITDLIAAQHQAEQDRGKVESILKMIQNRKELKLFLLETKTQVSNLDNELAKLKSDPHCSHDSILRALHTIKGGAATFSYTTLKETAHLLEDLMIARKSNSEASQNKSELEDLKNKIKYETSQIITFYKEVFGELSPQEDDNVLFSKQDIQHILQFKNIKDLQIFIEDRAYSQPLKNVTSQFPIVIQRTAQLLNKSIAPLKVANEAIRIPLKVFDPFFNSFIHVLRNSVDHGIESKDIRQAHSKPETGTLELDFQVTHHDGRKYLQITYKDDGQGINPIRIREKLTQNNISHSHLSDAEVIYFIFNPSFTTRDVVTETSGRGVGLDAVKHEIDQLGGSIKIKSEIGRFTEFIFNLPYPLSQVDLKQAS